MLRDVRIGNYPIARYDEGVQQREHQPTHFREHFIVFELRENHRHFIRYDHVDFPWTLLGTDSIQRRHRDSTETGSVAPSTEVITGFDKAGANG